MMKNSLAIFFLLTLTVVDIHGFSWNLLDFLPWGEWRACREDECRISGVCRPLSLENELCGVGIINCPCAPNLECVLSDTMSRPLEWRRRYQRFGGSGGRGGPLWWRPRGWRHRGGRRRQWFRCVNDTTFPTPPDMNITVVSTTLPDLNITNGTTPAVGNITLDPTTQPDFNITVGPTTLPDMNTTIVLTTLPELPSNETTNSTTTPEPSLNATTVPTVTLETTSDVITTTTGTLETFSDTITTTTVLP